MSPFIPVIRAAASAEAAKAAGAAEVTERLYYNDSYLREFRANVLTCDANRVYLDRTAFYPSAGGQPFDTGCIGSVSVIEVIDEGEDIAHIVDGSVAGEVTCSIDWARRFDHMQQHSGQHLLSGVLQAEFGIATLSFHLGAQVSTIDVDAASIDSGQLSLIERRTNELVWANRAVRVSYHEAEDEIGLRKQVERTGKLRVVTMEGVDRSACGGTHVRATGEIGTVLVRGIEKIRGKVRIEFVCGGRAVDRARSDFAALARVARLFSSGLDEAADLAESQQARLAEAERRLRKFLMEAAEARGKSLHSSTEANADGLRIHVRRIESDGIEEDLRTEAQAFTSCGRAVFVAAALESGALLLTVSADSGLNAGTLLKAALAKVGGRGGGGATLAQGNFADRERVERAVAELTGFAQARPNADDPATGL
jgi:alanyl-tRNA synthetase